MTDEVDPRTDRTKTHDGGEIGRKPPDVLAGCGIQGHGQQLASGLASGLWFLVSYRNGNRPHLKESFAVRD